MKAFLLCLILVISAFAVAWCLIAKQSQPVSSAGSILVHRSYLSSVVTLAKRAHHDCKLDNQVLQLVTLSGGSMKIVTKGEARVPLLERIPVIVSIDTNLERTNVTISPQIIDAINGSCLLTVTKSGRATRITSKILVQPRFATPPEFHPIVTERSQQLADKLNNDLEHWLKEALK